MLTNNRIDSKKIKTIIETTILGVLFMRYNKKRSIQKKLFPFLLLGSFCITACNHISFSEQLSNLSSENKKTNNSKEESAKREVFAMDTYMTLTAYGENAEKAVNLAEEEITKLDKLLSTGLQTSEINKLNREGTAVLSTDTAYLMEQTLKICKDTKNSFNPAIYPIMELWGFPDKNYSVPTKKQLEKTLKLTDISKISFQEETGLATLLDGMKIDFGGIAKGYASQKVIDIFKENEINSGIIDLGGNIYVLGNKTDGSSWHIAIKHPEKDEEILGILSLADKAIITSGGYERYFEKDGKTYHHIIDPSTGYPAENGLLSVSIISEDGTLADAMSTALFVMGKDAAISYWKKHSDQFNMILFTEDGELYITKELENVFASDFKIKVIEN